MIPYNELCHALEAAKSRRQAEAELRELERIDDSQDDVGVAPVDYGDTDATAVAVAAHGIESTQPGFSDAPTATSEGYAVESDFPVDGIPTVPGPEGYDLAPMAVDTLPQGPESEPEVEVGDGDVIGESEVEVRDADVIASETVEKS